MATATRRIEMCVSDIHSWMAVNMLKLNTDKTELLYFHSRFRPRLQLNPIRLGSDVIFPSSHAKNIGVIFDSSMTVSRHMNAIVKSGYYHLRKIAKIRNVLALDTTKILIHAFVVSKIDSYNSLIFGLPKHLIDKLQHLLNAAARLIMVAYKYDSITPILKEPVEQRIIFEINLITFKCLNNLAPSYLTLFRLGFFGQSVTGEGVGGLLRPPLCISGTNNARVMKFTHNDHLHTKKLHTQFWLATPNDDVTVTSYSDFSMFLIIFPLRYVKYQ